MAVFDKVDYEFDEDLESAKWREFHNDAIIEFDNIQATVRDERMQCVEDRRFYSIAGAQWEGLWSKQFANKPRPEMNKIHLAVIRIFNEYRNNRITVDFQSKDGTKNDQLADACDGLYRSDEKYSGGQEAYDNAFEEGVGGGMGAWEYEQVYEDEEDEENEQQRIRIGLINDADSTVFFDLDAKRKDKSDARRCFRLVSYSPAKYQEEFGDSPDTWPKDIQKSEFDWSSPHVIWVAKVYDVMWKRTTLYIYETVSGDEVRFTEEDFTDDPKLKATLKAVGHKLKKKRKLKQKKIHLTIMSGGRILEDCGYIAGKNIPVNVFYGKRWFVDNVERCMGHVRLSKDAQRLKNMLMSNLEQLCGKSQTEKPIFLAEQMIGHDEEWSTDNVQDNPYLLINPVTDANGQMMPVGPIAFTKPIQIPPVMAALHETVEKDLMDLNGNQQAGEEIHPNVSGKVLELVQTRLDMQAFIYLSNFADSMRRGGEIWLSMGKELYLEEGRKMKSIGPQGEIESLELMKPMIDPKTDKSITINDLSQANFDVEVDVGPSSNSQRQATVRALISLMQMTDDPEIRRVLTAMAISNMDGEGLGDLRDWFRKQLLKMGVAKPTEEEKEELANAQANQQPDANQEYLKAAANQANAEAVNANADTLYKVAKAGESKASAAEKLAGISRDNRQQLLNTVQQLTEQQNQAPAAAAEAPAPAAAIDVPPPAPLNQ